VKIEPSWKHVTTCPGGITAFYRPTWALFRYRHGHGLLKNKSVDNYGVQTSL